jgi:hypothetical protein
VIVGHNREAKPLQQWDDETLNELFLARKGELFGYCHWHFPFSRTGQMGLTTPHGYKKQTVS